MMWKKIVKWHDNHMKKRPKQPPHRERDSRLHQHDNDSDNNDNDDDEPVDEKMRIFITQLFLADRPHHNLAAVMATAKANRLLSSSTSTTDDIFLEGPLLPPINEEEEEEKEETKDDCDNDDHVNDNCDDNGDDTTIIATNTSAAAAAARNVEKVMFLGPPQVLVPQNKTIKEEEEEKEEASSLDGDISDSDSEHADPAAWIHVGHPGLMSKTRQQQQQRRSWSSTLILFVCWIVWTRLAMQFHQHAATPLMLRSAPSLQPKMLLRLSSTPLKMMPLPPIDDEHDLSTGHTYAKPKTTTTTSYGLRLAGITPLAVYNRP